MLHLSTVINYPDIFTHICKYIEPYKIIHMCNKYKHCRDIISKSNNTLNVETDININYDYSDYPINHFIFSTNIIDIFNFSSDIERILKKSNISYKDINTRDRSIHMMVYLYQYAKTKLIIDVSRLGVCNVKNDDKDGILKFDYNKLKRFTYIDPNYEKNYKLNMQFDNRLRHKIIDELITNDDMLVYNGICSINYNSVKFIKRNDKFVGVNDYRSNRNGYDNNINIIDNDNSYNSNRSGYNNTNIINNDNNINIINNNTNIINNNNKTQYTYSLYLKNKTNITIKDVQNKHCNHLILENCKNIRINIIVNGTVILDNCTSIVLFQPNVNNMIIKNRLNTFKCNNVEKLHIQDSNIISNCQFNNVNMCYTNILTSSCQFNNIRYLKCNFSYDMNCNYVTKYKVRKLDVVYGRNCFISVIDSPYIHSIKYTFDKSKEDEKNDSIVVLYVYGCQNLKHIKMYIDVRLLRYNIVACKNLEKLDIIDGMNNKIEDCKSLTINYI